MKRVVAVLSTVLVFVLAAVLLAGCGDTGKAKEYMNTADEQIKQLQTELQNWSTEMQQRGPKMTDQASTDAAVADFESSSEALTKKIEAVKAKYEKIDSLNGVDDYKEYSALAVKFLDKVKEMVDAGVTFVNDIVESATSGATPEQITAISNEFTTTMQKLGQEVTEQADAADKFKQDKDL